MPINPEGGFETELERDIRMSRKRYANRVYTNANKSLVDQRFRVFHCKRCTSYVLITDADIQSAPRRRTDNALVFCPDKNFVKLRTRPVFEPVKVRRLRGIETQYLHACADCGLHIAYQSVPHNGGPKSASPAPAPVDVSLSTPTTASPAPGSSYTPSPASSASSQAATNAGAPGTVQSPFAATSHELITAKSARSGVDEISSSAASSISTSNTGSSSTPCTSSSRAGQAVDGHSSVPASWTSSDGVTAASPGAGSTVSPGCFTLQNPSTNEATGNPDAEDKSGASKQAPTKKVASPVSAPLIYLIETAVIFPTKVTQIRLRCRICGFVPRNELHFEEHKRERGHWDQDSGQFAVPDDNGDTPINPIIVG